MNRNGKAVGKVIDQSLTRRASKNKDAVKLTQRLQILGSRFGFGAIEWSPTTGAAVEHSFYIGSGKDGLHDMGVREKGEFGLRKRVMNSLKCRQA